MANKAVSLKTFFITDYTLKPFYEVVECEILKLSTNQFKIIYLGYQGVQLTYTCAIEACNWPRSCIVRVFIFKCVAHLIDAQLVYNQTSFPVLTTAHGCMLLISSLIFFKRYKL